jgi:hypothetical protein
MYTVKNSKGETIAITSRFSDAEALAASEAMQNKTSEIQPKQVDNTKG